MRDLSKTEGIPLYVKIRESIREMIASGELERGNRLPSEDELATQYGVSRMTVRQGISDLIDDGLLYRRHGVGTFVALPHIERDHSRLIDFFENSNVKGINTKSSILNIEVIPVNPKIAKALLLEDDDLVIRIHSLRYADDVPVTMHDAYIPYNLFSDLVARYKITRSSTPLVRIRGLWISSKKRGSEIGSAPSRS